MGYLFCPIALGLSGCDGKPLCSSEVLQIAHDLGSDRYAVTEVRNCGATTDYVTVVRVGRAGEPQSAAAEVFVANSDHGAAIEGKRDAIWTSVVWPMPGKLSIAYASKARVFKHELDAEGASISYKASDPLTMPPVP